MESLRKRFEQYPELARLAPFAVYVLLTQLQGQFGPASTYWMYVVKTVLAAWMVWEVRPFVAEMRWCFSWEAVVVGVVVFGIWVGFDGFYPRLSQIDSGWNPHTQFGEGSALAWFFVLFRWAGSTAIAPMAEEIFYRSFLYRYMVKLDFRAMPLGQFHPLSFIVTSVIFGLMHPQWWVAGILCGLAYQGLVVRKNRLGDAMTAHAITNFLLALWVVWKHAWVFW
jgi:CAAX prenyl protease-like protein